MDGCRISITKKITPKLNKKMQTEAQGPVDKLKASWVAEVLSESQLSTGNLESASPQKVDEENTDFTVPVRCLFIYRSTQASDRM